MSERDGRVEPILVLTSLRFLPAVWVVVHHFGVGFPLPAPLEHAVHRGFVGVTFFFVLSGFILAINYPVERLRARSFLVARFARIYPLYLLGIALVAPLYFDAVVESASVVDAILETILQSLLSAFLLQAWFPGRAALLNPAGWSLSAEAFFYLAFVPVLLWSASRAFLNRTLLSATAMWLAGLGGIAIWMLLHPGLLPVPGLGPEQTWSTNLVSFHPVLRIPEFLIGVALGLWHAKGGAIARPGLVATACLLLLAGLVLSWPDSLLPFLHNTLAAPLFGLLVVALAQCGGRVVYLLESPRLVLLGEASYALYILHIPVFYWFRLACRKLGFAEQGPVATPLYLLVVGVLSVLAFQYVETPARKWLRGRLQPAPVRP